MPRLTKHSLRWTPRRTQYGMRIFGALALVVAISARFGPVAVAAGEHLAVSGLGDRSTLIAADPGHVLSEVVPAGDVDGDGLADLLLRLQPEDPLEPAATDLVVLLYGGRSLGGVLRPLGVEGPRSILSVGSVTPVEDAQQHGGLSGGEDVDGDGRDDFVAISSLEPDLGSAAILLVLGNEEKNEIPDEFDGRSIGQRVRGTRIVLPGPFQLSARLGPVLTLCRDLSGDGRAEIVFLESGGAFQRHRCYVLFGSAEFPAVVDPSEIGEASAPGLVIESEGALSLESIVSLGDIDGDGLGELAWITCTRQSCRGENAAVFALFGSKSFASRFSVDAFDADDGLHLPGYSRAARAGDVDGDGIGDAVLSTDTGPIGDGWAQILLGRPRNEFPNRIDRDVFLTRELGTTVVQSRQFDAGLGTPSPKWVLSAGRDLERRRRRRARLGSALESSDVRLERFVRPGRIRVLGPESVPGVVVDGKPANGRLAGGNRRPGRLLETGSASGPER